MILERTAVAQERLLKLSQTLSNGSISPYEVLELYGELNNLYYETALHLATRFSAKEQAYIQRKIQQAKKTKEFRKDLNVSDSTIEALNSVEIQLMNEADAMYEYEQYKLLLKSLDNSLAYIRSLKTSVEKLESNPTIYEQN